MKSKIRLIFTLCLLMAFLLAACDGGGGQDKNTSTPEEPASISSTEVPVTEVVESNTPEPASEEGASPTEEEIEY